MCTLALWFSFNFISVVRARSREAKYGISINSYLNLDAWGQPKLMINTTTYRGSGTHYYLLARIMH